MKTLIPDKPREPIKCSRCGEKEKTKLIRLYGNTYICRDCYEKSLGIHGEEKL